MGIYKIPPQMKNSNLPVIQMANIALNAVCSAASGVAMVAKANFSDRGLIIENSFISLQNQYISGQKYKLTCNLVPCQI